jgi:hypothetical protein
VKCPYCNSEANLVTGYEIYPHRPDLADLKAWACRPCDAWVGTHKNSPEHKPLGRLANAELRKAKMAAHAVFDPLWKSGRMSRKEAYSMLSEKMSIPKDQAHIGMFDVDQCRAVVNIFSPKVVL